MSQVRVASARFVNATTGREVNAKRFQRSLVGEEFDEYVFRGVASAFPFSPVGAASRDLKELWKGRRFKIHYNDKWRQGKVISWTQYNPSPRDMVTKWTVVLELDTVEVGDKISMTVEGAVMSHESNEQGTVTVTCQDDDTEDLVIMPSANKKLVPRMKLHVNRLNVEGGGTLKLDADGEELISLEWLEPALPLVNLNEDVLSFDCPCCRAVEPVMSAFETSCTTRTGECPVCLDTDKECRVLACGHGVCHGCWRSCRHAAMRVSVDLGDIDEEEMMKEREKRDRLVLKKRSRNGDPVTNPFVARFIELAEAATDVPGLQRLRFELMVEPPPSWVSSEAVDHYDKLSLQGLKVLINVIHTRQEVLEQLDGSFSRTAFMAAVWIAKAYDATQNYRASVPWAELSLHHGKKSISEGQENFNLGRAYAFVSMFQAKADLFSKSLENYTALMEHCETAISRSLEEGRQLILDQMQEWTGSSGKLTAGI